MAAGEASAGAASLLGIPLLRNLLMRHKPYTGLTARL
jgi:hypothetical protein